MFCRKCGKELEDGAAFCQFCGQKQTEDSSEKKEKEAGKREEQIGNKQLVLAGVVMAAVILAVIAGFKLVVGDRKEKAAGEIATQETVQEENDSEELTEKMPKEESISPLIVAGMRAMNGFAALGSESNLHFGQGGCFFQKLLGTCFFNKKMAYCK